MCLWGLFSVRLFEKKLYLTGGVPLTAPTTPHYALHFYIARCKIDTLYLPKNAGTDPDNSSLSKLPSIPGYFQVANVNIYCSKHNLLSAYLLVYNYKRPQKTTTKGTNEPNNLCSSYMLLRPYQGGGRGHTLVVKTTRISSLGNI